MASLPMLAAARLTGGRIRSGMTAQAFREVIPMIPTKDSLLAGWTANADTLLTAQPTDFGCTTAQALQFHTLNQAWTDSYNAVVAAKASGSQTKPLTQAKDTAK